MPEAKPMTVYLPDSQGNNPAKPPFREKISLLKKSAKENPSEFLKRFEDKEMPKEDRSLSYEACSVICNDEVKEFLMKELFSVEDDAFIIEGIIYGLAPRISEPDVVDALRKLREKTNQDFVKDICDDFTQGN